MGFNKLPVELIDTIASSVAQRDLLSLCRTNRKVNTACLRWLYRTVVLTDQVSAVVCFTTIISNQQAARSVRSLRVRFDSALMLKAFARITRAALEKLTALDDVELPAPSEIFALISGIHFPRLRQCTIPFSVHTIGFIKRHLQLHHLWVDPVPHEELEFPQSFDPVLLPELQVFSGPDSIAHAVIPGSRVSHAVVFWDPRGETDCVGMFEAIGASGTQLRDLNNIVVVWDPMLPTAAAKYLPSLSVLAVRNVSALPAPHTLETFFSCIDTNIKTFANLTTLCIVQGTGPAPLDASDLDWEFQTVRRWADLCPSLRCCVLPSETKWMCTVSNVWYPRNQTDNAVDMVTRFRWFVKTVVASAALPPAYDAILEVIGGKEMVAALRRAYEEQGDVPEFRLTETPVGDAVTFITF
ncbi:hypothetical protein C8R46DRAFT_1362225 [Mycena filopes]|nr:hypothetical protein C8R46DRAFT_1362225 [Mycena filopes]